MANEKRLIDANEVERKIKIAISSWQRDCNGNAPVIARAMEDALQRVIYAPTVDAVEVVHGRWIEKIDMVESYLADSTEVFYECSVCECANIGESPYCPNCGAKMDGGNEDG